MNDIQVFDHPMFGQLRVVEIQGEPWFVAADVCKGLDLTNPTVSMARLDTDEKAKLNLGLAGGDTNIVSFPGLLSLVLSSRKPEAKEYKRWPTHEVLPSIHKHGAYMTPETIEKVLLTPDFIIGLATQLKEEQQRSLVLEAENAVLKPKALFADAVNASDSTILVRDLAKLIEQNLRQLGHKDTLGEKRLFKWLRENGYLISKHGLDYNSPTQRSITMGLFRIKESTVTHSDGSTTISKTSRVTGKGQTYFVNKFLSGFSNQTVIPYFCGA